MERIEVIKRLIINNLKTNLELLNSLGIDVDIEQSRISILESIQKFVSAELSHYKGEQLANSDLNDDNKVQSNSNQELSEEEIERQAQDVLEHIQKYGSINTLMPIPKEVLKLVNRKLDDIGNYNKPKQPSQSEEPLPPEAKPLVTTTIPSIVLDEVNERLKQIKEKPANEEDLLRDEKQSEIIVEPLNPKQAAQREEQIQLLVKHYLEFGKLNPTISIPPDVLEEVTRRIVSQRSEIKVNAGMHK